MPVTAKFSREFYNKFGHEAVDELVNFLNRIDLSYRSELRELNEFNFARFDAKLEQRTAELKAEFERRIAQLDAKLEQRTAELKAEFERRIAQLDAKLEQRTAELRAAFEGALEQRIAQFDARLERRIAQAESRLIRWTFAFWAPTMLAVVALMIGVIVKL